MSEISAPASLVNSFSGIKPTDKRSVSHSINLSEPITLSKFLSTFDIVISEGYLGHKFNDGSKSMGS
ncbi:MAG: hypothetical protein ACFFDF_21505 [Candidatus Odinarchaeota archaeon]